MFVGCGSKDGLFHVAASVFFNVATAAWLTKQPQVILTSVATTKLPVFMFGECVAKYTAWDQGRCVLHLRLQGLKSL